jgi:hypothetical protein
MTSDDVTRPAQRGKAEGAQPLGCSGLERLPGVGSQGQLGGCFGRLCSLKAALLFHGTFPRSLRTIWAIAVQSPRIDQTA